MVTAPAADCQLCRGPFLPFLWRNCAGFRDALPARTQLHGFHAQPIGVARQEVSDDPELGIAVASVQARQRLTRGLKEMAPAPQTFFDRRNEHTPSIL